MSNPRLNISKDIVNGWRLEAEGFRNLGIRVTQEQIIAEMYARMGIFKKIWLGFRITISQAYCHLQMALATRRLLQRVDTAFYPPGPTISLRNEFVKFVWHWLAR